MDVNGSIGEVETDVAGPLSAQLFSEDEDLKTYAILDGASIDGLLDQLYGEDPPEFRCLYRGDLEPDMAEVAPYLVELSPKAPFARWLLANCWGKHWGIFLTASEDIDVVRRHFRTFLMVKNPEGKQVYFRYYDPRVLRTFLPTCEGPEVRFITGPVRTFFCEQGKDARLSSFVADGHRFKESQVSLLS